VQHHDEHRRTGRQPSTSRAPIGKLPGLDWQQTYVLKATGDLAMELWECRLTLSDVAERLALKTGISRRQIEQALGPLSERGYLHADDAPGHPEIMLQLMPNGLDEYCYRFVRGYGSARLDVLRMICKDVGYDVHELARRTGHPALLIEHILDGAQAEGLLRVMKHGQYVRVTEIRPQLRRIVSGAA
jgi:hypothetical protein